MNRDQKPHSRDKKVGSGSVDLHRGQQINTGNRPVSGGSRPGASGMRSSGNTSSPSGISVLRGLPIKLNFKTILIIVGVIVVALILFKLFGGFSANLPTNDLRFLRKSPDERSGQRLRGRPEYRTRPLRFPACAR